MKRLLFFLAASLLWISCASAAARYFVAFTDKPAGAWSVSRPGEFLSERAVERHKRTGAGITSADLPVSEAYVRSVAATGAAIIRPLRWFNGVLVETDDASVLESVRRLAHVRSVTALNVPPSVRLVKRSGVSPGVPAARMQETRAVAPAYAYGEGYNQVHMLHADALHQLGFDGAGRVIAVLDDGFHGVDALNAFDSLRSQGRILGTWDFVDNEADVYDDDTHGMKVLSCISANLPGQLVGTAPQAAVYLLRTETIFTESLLEEYNWAAAAEYADSAGADIISSSLGYFTFTDTSADHTYAQFDGHTTVAARAANRAASAGMLVVISAGNEGASPWYHITTPSDADSALAVGAVDAYGDYAYFSGAGPAADGDIKPNVVAQGQDAAYAEFNNTVSTGNGTSFSAPIVAGAAACLWQAAGSAGCMDVLHAIERSANRYEYPDAFYGYGIPNFLTAYTLLTNTLPDGVAPHGLMAVYPVPFSDQIHLLFESTSDQTVHVSMYDVTGRVVYSDDRMLATGIQHLGVRVPSLARAVYVLRITANGTEYSRLLMRQ